MRTLDILVPQYTETDKEIKPLLDSLAVQQNVDFDEVGVIIVNDGSEVFLSDELINSYPFNIEYYKESHRGVSGTRNSCMDHSTAKYIMFCDADDMFYNACGLWIVFREIGLGFDVMPSKFVEEARTTDTNEVIYLNHEKDSTFVHGKVFRRQFLINNNIRWNESLTIHEDSYFNCLAQQVALIKPNVIKYCSESFYMWRWRSDSVCRKDKLYLNKTYVNMLESNTALVDAYVDRNMESPAINCVVSMTYETYYNLQTNRWKSEEGSKYIDQTEKRFAKYWSSFKYLFEKVDGPQKSKIVSSIQNKYTKAGLTDVEITFSDWIKRIEGYGRE